MSIKKKCLSIIYGTIYVLLNFSLTKSIEELETAVKSGDNEKIEMAKTNFITKSKDPLSDWLDSRFGATVTDNAIFASLPQHWEEEFHKDMEALHVSHLANLIKKIISSHRS